MYTLVGALYKWVYVCPIALNLRHVLYRKDVLLPNPASAAVSASYIQWDIVTEEDSGPHRVCYSMVFFWEGKSEGDVFKCWRALKVFFFSTLDSDTGALQMYASPPLLL